MTKLNRHGYKKLIDEDIEWVMKQPRTLERDHVVLVLKESVRLLYGPACEECQDGIARTKDPVTGLYCHRGEGRMGQILCLDQAFPDDP